MFTTMKKSGCMAKKEFCTINKKLDAFIGVRVPQCIKDLYIEYAMDNHQRNIADLYRAAICSHIYKLLGWE